VKIVAFRRFFLLAKRGFKRPYRQEEEKFKINELIRAKEVRLVGESGEPVVVSLSAALEMANERGLDLVEISSTQDFPIVKIIDYKKFKFEQTKKAKEAKKKQKVIHVKEIKMRPNIDTHDFMHKIKHAREFMTKGDKVKFTLMFRGREMAHQELGFDVMKKILKELDGFAVAEKHPVKEGRNITMFMTLSATGQKNA
jgi:translation initiation factor IF-3